MRQLHPGPLAMLHPSTAAEYGVEDGDWILIENTFGCCKMQVEVDSRLKPGVVSADHGWWFPELKDHKEEDGTGDELYGVFKCNINKTLPMRPGKTGLGNSYKSQLCRIEKLEDGESYDVPTCVKKA
jgi:anaerobic selenocysteine-containing dehydrogenase